MGNFFKSIAVLLSVPLLLSGCNSSATSAENQQSSIQEEENLSDKQTKIPLPKLQKNRSH